MLVFIHCLGKLIHFFGDENDSGEGNDTGWEAENDDDNEVEAITTPPLTTTTTTIEQEQEGDDPVSSTAMEVTKAILASLDKEDSLQSSVTAPAPPLAAESVPAAVTETSDSTEHTKETNGHKDSSDPPINTAINESTSPSRLMKSLIHNSSSSPSLYRSVTPR